MLQDLDILEDWTAIRKVFWEGTTWSQISLISEFDLFICLFLSLSLPTGDGIAGATPGEGGW